MQNVKVLYIAGHGRSGSTLLDRLLGRIPGFFSCGEIALIWRRGFIENRLCGCRQPFHSCAFWTRVVERFEKEYGPINPEETERLELSVYQRRYVPFHLSPWKPASFRDRSSRFADVLRVLYSAIRDESGADVLVDSSKNPLYALLLSQTPGIDLYVVHLVRDSRAVAYSWSRKKLRLPEDAGRKEYMRQYSSAKSAFDWDSFNLLTDLTCRDSPSMLLRYEDLVAGWPVQLRQMFSTFGFPPGLLEAQSETDIHPLPNHIVAGNPMRFEDGPLHIRQDDEWKGKMSPLSRASVTLLSAPLLHRYGYSLAQGGQ